MSYCTTEKRSSQTSCEWKTELGPIVFVLYVSICYSSSLFLRSRGCSDCFTPHYISMLWCKNTNYFWDFQYVDNWQCLGIFRVILFAINSSKVTRDGARWRRSISLPLSSNNTSTNCLQRRIIFSFIFAESVFAGRLYTSKRRYPIVW